MCEQKRESIWDQYGSQRGGDIGAARAGFNGYEVLSWRCFGSKDVRRSLLDLPFSFLTD
jgi:hypothetical protein